MASRKQEKEQARATRLAQEQARAAGAQRRRRLQVFGGVIASAVIVVVVAIAISSGGSTNTGGLRHGQAATALYDSINAELSDIPESGATLGNPNAKVTMTYFGDLQCPVCMAFTTGEDGGGLPEFIAKDVRSGAVKIDYRAFCTATCNPANKVGGQSVFNTQQAYALAAGKQNLFWYYAELFYHQQGAEDSGYATPAFLNGIAAEIPKLDAATWRADRNDSALVAQVTSDADAGTQDGVEGTPTVFMSGPKGNAEAGSGILTYGQLHAAAQLVS